MKLQKMKKGKKNLKPNDSEDARITDLIKQNDNRGGRPFKTRNKVGERPISLRQQRQAKRDLE